MAKPKLTLEERFWSYVDKSGECWNWIGSRGRQGYGQFATRDGKKKAMIRSHRFSYSLSFGQIPDGLCVLHRCDNPSYVNPSHLFAGTIADNQRDMIAKGRAKFGVRHPAAKLTEAQVHAIRADTRSSAVIAREYPVNAGTVRTIKLGRLWRKLPDSPESPR